MGLHALVFYHCPSTDGAFALWAFDMYAKAKYDDTRYVPVKDGNGILETIPVHQNDKDTAVYMLDWLPNTNDLATFGSRFEHVTVISNPKKHGILMQQFCDTVMLAERRNIKFVMSDGKSSCLAALEHFRKTAGKFVNLSFRKHDMMFNYVCDYVMNAMKFTDTNLFMDGIDAKGMYMRYDINKNPSLFDTLNAMTAEELVREGTEFHIQKKRVLNEYLSKNVVREVKTPELTCSARVVEIANEFYFIVDSLSTELLNCDNPKVHLSIVYRENPANSDEYLLTLRSSDLVNCMEIATRVGGYGKRRGARIVIPKTDLDKVFNQV